MSRTEHFDLEQYQTESSNVECGCCSDESALSDHVLARSPPARTLKVTSETPPTFV
ncbi:hypothetical protein J6590_078762 [Homalodisca vitripennis]|nr:hypothetical protein J6590_078762 [Homalodisca vitripennis]